MKAKNLFVVLKMFVALLVFISLGSCSKDNDVINEENKGTEYLTTDKPLPSYVVSAFKEQFVPQKKDVKIYANPVKGSIDEWQFTGNYKTMEKVGAGTLGSRYKYYRYVIDYICRVKIEYGNVDFQQKSGGIVKQEISYSEYNIKEYNF